MTEQSVLDRATTLAEMAPHSSVAVGVLAGREGEFPDARLAGRPPVSYLEPSEAPAYVLTNRKRGIGLGTKRNRTTPDDNRGTVVMITGRRTLCLVGQETDDEVFEVPHRSLSAVEYRTGLFANRVLLEGSRKRYHVWVGRGADEALLEQTTAYVEERLPADPDPADPANPDPADTAEEAVGTITYRGKEYDPSEIA